MRFDIGVLAGIVVLAGFPAVADELRVDPPRMQLSGPRAQQQLVVSRMLPEGLRVDLTRDVEYESSRASVISVTRAGVVRPVSDGTAELIVRYHHLTARVPVTVAGYGDPQPIDFHNEVLPALSRGGCSQGACHGSPQGKNGFRLSLRGFDPSLDVETLTREGAIRRLDPFSPDNSLLLLKAAGKVAHGGGKRLQVEDRAYQLLRQWISEGHRAADESPILERLEVLPPSGRLHVTSPRQQLVAIAHFDDGTTRDVTDVTVFTAANEEAVSVSAGGLAKFHATGEAAILARYLDQVETVRLGYVDEDPRFEFAAPRVVNYVDELVFAKQRDLQLRPASVATDSVFLRRVYLDLIGAIPTPDEARRFLDSSDPSKRGKLIDELLQRDEYAQFWALKWADVMRGNRETISHRGVHNFHRYLIRNFDEDRPFHQVAQEILTSLGNTIHEPAANFFRVSRSPNDAAESFSQLFLGVRIQCAKCHNHPYESITQRDYYGLAAAFARVRIKGTRFGIDDEVVYVAKTGEVKMPGADEEMAPAAFGRQLSDVEAESDRRVGLAEWLTAPENGYFARSTVNRVWSHLMGQGLVEPIDDFRDSNPASNPELLDALANDFAASGYRFRPLMRTILNSSTYQLAASLETPQTAKAANEDRYFTRARVRLLSAEQLIDAISTATGLPELFQGYPEGTRAIALAEGAIEHKFLQAFTRPVRDVACDCARESEPSLNQVVHLINNENILDKIDAGESRLGRAIAEGVPTPALIELLYLSTLSRRPTRDEEQFAHGYLTASESTAAGLRDLQHALINSNEFLLRH